MTADTISIEPLDCGTLTAGRDLFELGADAERIELPVPTWLIRHPQGTVLFDTGMHPDLTGPSEYLDGVSLFFEVGLTADELVGARLEAAGVDPSDVDVVVLSHLHFDHTGGLVQIPDARVVVHADEWATAADDELAAAANFRPEDYRLGHDVVTTTGEHDVFGDGRVVTIPTPGHTPGHQSLRVRLADREVVLAADCAYFERTIDGGPLPPIGHDAEQHAASVRHLRELRSSGAVVIPGHDRASFDALPDRLV